MRGTEPRLPACSGGCGTAGTRTLESPSFRNDTVDLSRIDSLMNVLRTTAAAASGQASAPAGSGGAVDFSSVLKGMLDQVNATQQTSEKLAQAFELGEPNVSLTDAMVAMQKANITLQTTIQVRNRLVSAYNDIMNMQV
jgi:flagellar hook-basal body complex protein FliE